MDPHDTSRGGAGRLCRKPAPDPGEEDALTEEGNASQEAGARESIKDAAKEFGAERDQAVLDRALLLYGQGNISAEDAVEAATIRLGEEVTSDTDAKADQNIPFSDLEPGSATKPVQGLPQEGDEGAGAGGAQAPVPPSDADAGGRAGKGKSPVQGEFPGTEPI